MRRILLLLLMATTSCTTKPDRAESTKLPERSGPYKDHVSTKDASAYEVTPGEQLIIYSGSVAAGSFKINEKTLNILTKHHITTIVCLKSCSFSVEMAEEKGFTVETLDYDPQSGPSTEMIKTFLSIYQKRKGLIFINSDSSSSGLLIMGIRIQKMGWTRS
ncbi:hypothetical protein KKF34_02845 [Myxococcota bacterium]|nr:hypothetical protein [Myxococcota bacterium]MBU1382582.1 hypothetical protein [Myxococcota bacterium]MBU1495799.1 hypothetical protein [Myxococcota bacterium]